MCWVVVVIIIISLLLCLVHPALGLATGLVLLLFIGVFLVIGAAALWILVEIVGWGEWSWNTAFILGLCLAVLAGLFRRDVNVTVRNEW